MRNFIVETIDVCEIPASQIARKITVLEAIHMEVNAWDKVISKCILNCFRKAGFSQIESDEEELQEVEFIDTNFENWISIDRDLPTFGELSDKELTDLQKKIKKKLILMIMMTITKRPMRKSLKKIRELFWES